MKYDSPKQIRRRQNAANDKAARISRPIKYKLISDEEWETTCAYHLNAIQEKSNKGDAFWADVAGRHARALASLAVCRRALEIQRDFRRAYWKATAMARHELYNCEI